MTKEHRAARTGKPHAQRKAAGPAMRSPRTRSKIKVVNDPIANDVALNQTLRDMKLYAADISGDGNCLFRALSDQLYGTPNHHMQIRQQICDFLVEYKSRYAAFVDDPILDADEAFERHVSSMRTSGTYGSHLEISVFSHIVQRPIKVIQPGMIYVISAEDESPAALQQRQQEQQQQRASATAKCKGKMPATSLSQNPLYIIYHSWEHYSSARNIQGPHTGLPQIITSESTAEETDTPTGATQNLTAEEKLVMTSLPNPDAHTRDEIRALIASTGSWETALDVLQREDVLSDPSQSKNTSSWPNTPESTTQLDRPASASSQELPEIEKEVLLNSPSLPTKPLDNPVRVRRSKRLSQASNRNDETIDCHVDKPNSMAQRDEDSSSSLTDLSASDSDEVVNAIIDQKEAHCADRSGGGKGSYALRSQSHQLPKRVSRKEASARIVSGRERRRESAIAQAPSTVEADEQIFAGDHKWTDAVKIRGRNASDQGALHLMKGISVRAALYVAGAIRGA